MGNTAFAEAFESGYTAKLHELGVEDGVVGADPRRLGERVALLIAARTRWSDQLGPLYSSADVQQLSGMSRQAVQQAVDAHRLLRLRRGGTRTGYPAFQFDGAGHPLPGLRPVLIAFAAAPVSGYLVASWLTSPRDELAGRTPAAALADSTAAELVAALASRDAARLTE